MATATDERSSPRVENKFACTQLRIRGIFSDVRCIFAEVLFAAHQTIPVFFLPESTCSIHLLVNGSGGKSLPGFQNILNPVAVNWAKQHMHVVRHHNEGCQVVSRSIK